LVEEIAIEICYLVGVHLSGRAGIHRPKECEHLGKHMSAKTTITIMSTTTEINVCIPQTGHSLMILFFFNYKVQIEGLPY